MTKDKEQMIKELVEWARKWDVVYLEADKMATWSADEGTRRFTLEYDEEQSVVGLSEISCTTLAYVTNCAEKWPREE